MNRVHTLLDQVALVTGASRGIGLAIARRLGQMGARVSLCARNTANLERAASALRGEGIQVLALRTDVTRGDEITAMVSETQRELGPIDILVNNAGIGIFGPFHEQSEAGWDAVMDTNLKSVFLTSRAVAPEMIRRKTGHIINISFRWQAKTRSRTARSTARRNGDSSAYPAAWRRICARTASA